MIPVQPQPEPDDFDAKVRQKGLAWLKKKGIDPNAPPPKGTKLKPYWQASNYDLWEAYSGICAYLAIYFEWVSGASSTDHFIPKSQHAGMAYEWKNYRLACLKVNRDKGVFDVLDPFELKEGTFFLNLVSGKIYPNPDLNDAEKAMAEKTIHRLKLDSPEHNEMRARHYQNYEKGWADLEFIKEKSPFIYAEMIRQGVQ
ncbi:hypothetical protein [Gallibacterium anatis]|uniref:hypothetical protein n=1 Tax=Gallibacterium anatis TaxID=750 RepID=UPI000BA19046|nr:hypothetical protein [Gallibacterium anatis]WAX72038.1 hypothetical protein CF557_03195 [Gallibacterium anatis]